MPRNGFTFAVFVSREPDSFGGGSGFFEVGDDFFVAFVDFVSDVKSILVDMSILTDMAD